VYLLASDDLRDTDLAIESGGGVAKASRLAAFNPEGVSSATGSTQTTIDMYVSFPASRKPANVGCKGPAGPTAFWKVSNDAGILDDVHDRLRSADIGAWPDEEELHKY